MNLGTADAPLIIPVAFFAVTSIAMAALIISLIPLQPASATGDPVIAAAGDIACDPIDSGFHGGEGTPSRCHEMYTGAELVGGAFTAVLPLGDEQYGCGGAAAFEQSYDPAWGVEAVKSVAPTGAYSSCTTLPLLPVAASASLKVFTPSRPNA